MKDWADIGCEGCGELVCYIELVPGKILIHGLAFCTDCFDSDMDEEDDS